MVSHEQDAIEQDDDDDDNVEQDDDNDDNVEQDDDDDEDVDDWMSRNCNCCEMCYNCCYFSGRIGCKN